MKAELQRALDNTEMVYAQIVQIANDIVRDHTAEVTELIKVIEDNVDNLSNESIRQAILKLSLKAYTLGDIKEKSALKAECAETLRKEAYARKFNGTEGSVATKDNTATIETSNEIVVEAIYNSVSSLFKTKLDEIHRVVDSLKSVLMSRMQEAKMTASLCNEGE